MKTKEWNVRAINYLLILVLSFPVIASDDDDDDDHHHHIGAQGIQGVAGTNGANGATGAQGIAGTNGTNGADGADGATGAQGVAGTNGSDGAQGVAGINGADGSNGLDGAKGDTGSNGKNGVNSTSSINYKYREVSGLAANNAIAQFDCDHSTKRLQAGVGVGFNNGKTGYAAGLCQRFKDTLIKGTIGFESGKTSGGFGIKWLFD